MCVIVHKPAGQTLTEKDIRLAYENNPHGFGYMYYNEDTGRIKAKKSLKYKEEEIVKIFEELKDKDACMHYRWKTDGEIKDSQCHPFKILDKKRNGIDMYFMHNGVINSARKHIENKESDTQAFCRKFLQPILRKSPKLIETKAFQMLIEDYIGAGSKLCFMYGKGKVLKINESAGSQRDGCWVSNEYSFKDNYRPNRTTQSGNVNGARTNTSLTTTTNNSDETTNFLLQKIKVGDTMHVFHHDDETFYQEGVVLRVNPNTTTIEFKDVNNNKTQLVFWNSSGNTFSNRKETYYAIPETNMDSDNNNSRIEEDLLKKSQPKTTEQSSHQYNARHSSAKDTGQSSGKVTPIQDFLDRVDDDVYDEDDTKERFVSYKGETVDTWDKYDGYLEGPEDYYGVDCVSFRDIQQMDIQKRFEFFIDKPEIAFNMWQDLIDYICKEDDDSMPLSFDDIALENMYDEDVNSYLDNKFLDKTGTN